MSKETLSAAVYSTFNDTKLGSNWIFHLNAVNKISSKCQVTELLLIQRKKPIFCYIT